MLFTSRNRDLSRLGTLLEIPAMATEEGVQLLLRGYNDNDVQQVHKVIASSIINRFGKLALAIDQAAAYITYKRMALDRLGDFLTTYEAERHRILSYTPKKFWEYRKMHNPEEVENISAFTTWEMSFRQLGSGDEPWKGDAEHFLTLSAFFAPTSIAESLFRKYQERQDGEAKWVQIFSVADGVEDDGDDGDNEDNTNEDDKDEDEKHEDDEDEYMERVDASEQSSGNGFHSTWDHDRFWDLIAESNELSLLQSISPGTDQEGANFSLHPLIRDWLQLRLKAKERQKYTQEAIEVLARSMEGYDVRSVTVEERIALLTHMDVSMSNDGKFSKSRDRLGHNIANCRAAHWFAWLYTDQGRYRTSEELYRRILETQRSLLSENHPFMLRTMNSLAVVLHDQGKNEEAEVMHRQVLKLRETELGDKHAETLRSMNNLAFVLVEQGKYEEAEVMHRQTLKLRETELGDKHIDTLRSMNNLAIVLVDQGKYEEAEIMHRQTLKLREMELGDKHADTLLSMNNLAALLRDQGKHEEAERICRHTLMLRERLLGKEHLDTLSSMSELAWILHKQNKNDEAERICRQALLLQETVLSKENPETLWTMQNLTEILWAQGKHEEAERIYRETLMSRGKVLGKEHPRTLGTMQSLINILRAQGKYEEAEQICRQTLMLREKILGKEHPHTLLTMQSLTEILWAQGKHEEAERITPENANNDGDKGDVGEGRA